MAQPPTVAPSKDDTHEQPRWRIGIVLVGAEVDIPATKFLILAMNNAQSQVEYEIIPGSIDDELRQYLLSSEPIDREKARALARDFPARLQRAIAKLNAGYKLVDTRFPNYLIVISTACFMDNYFNFRVSGVSVIALGNWHSFMAPPSIFEFIQTLVVREAVASVCPALDGSIHLGSRGCICDFTPSLDEVRLKVLNGFVCEFCREKMSNAKLGSFADEITWMLSRAWLGTLEDNSSVASTLAKLGANLFQTKGLSPTWKERAKIAIQEDSVKESIKLIFAVLLAGLLFYLGWKVG